MDTKGLSKVELKDEFDRLYRLHGRNWKKLIREADPYYNTYEGSETLHAVKSGKAHRRKIGDVVEILRRESQAGIDLSGKRSIKSGKVQGSKREDAIKASLNRLPKAQSLEELEARRRKKMQKVN
jgi:hypothetical protein